MKTGHYNMLTTTDWQSYGPTGAAFSQAPILSLKIHAAHRTRIYTVIRIRYDTIREFNVDWKPECGQLNIARVTKNKEVQNKKKLKQYKRQGPVSTVQVQDP